MTDLTNDASPNLSSGAAGAIGNGLGSTTASTSGLSGSDAQTTAEQSRAAQLASETARKLEDRAYQARDWAVTQSDTVRTTVLDKPFISVGTAFAAGIVFGLLLRR
jgi:ElaB/YqjD/DUF883 family membrane-anchored ribosome-binding protein